MSLPALALNALIIIFDLLMIFLRLGFYGRFARSLAVSLIACIFLLMSGCALDLTGAQQAERELAAIPAVTSQPTAARPTLTPIPEFTPASPLEIAVTAAENFKRITPTVTPTVQPVESKEFPFPIMAEGSNFKEIPGGVWYTVNVPASEVEKFYLDDRVYYRWNYDYSDQTETHFDIVFRKYEERQQLMVWENPDREVTVITIADFEPLMESIDALDASVYQSDWFVLSDTLNLYDDGIWEYEIDLPLPILRAFYLSRMLNTGWQPFPIERPTSSSMILQFQRDEEQLTIRLEDSAVGTLVRGQRGTPR
ncbi:MAG: hypothetical protein AAF902_07800 [Chloroflexota bacterium]